MATEGKPEEPPMEKNVRAETQNNESSRMEKNVPAETQNHESSKNETEKFAETENVKNEGEKHVKIEDVKVEEKNVIETDKGKKGVEGEKAKDEENKNVESDNVKIEEKRKVETDVVKDEEKEDVEKMHVKAENMKDELKLKEEAEQKTRDIEAIEEKKNEDQEDALASKEESDLFPDLKDFKESEKKALLELRSKVEEAILTNKLFTDKKEQEKEASKEAEVEDKSMEKEKNVKQKEEVKKETKQEGKMTLLSVVEAMKDKVSQSVSQEGENKEGSASNETNDASNVAKDASNEAQEASNTAKVEEAFAFVDADEKDLSTRENNEFKDADGEPDKKEKANNVVTKEKEEGKKKEGVDFDKDISLWGIPLLPSKGERSTDIVLLKFLRARDFKVNEAFQMLKNTLKWRKENKIDSIMDEEFQPDLGATAFMEGKDREGHPICYNLFGALSSDQQYNKTLGNEEKREKYLRWRIQLMEKGIKNLDLQPDGVSEMLQITDLKNCPLPTKKEIRNATRKAVEILQDNYPELVSKNIFINIPFWYYAFSTLLLAFLTQRTKDKFIYARASKVTETLLKYIGAEEIPLHYGGLKRENDPDFTTEDRAKEVVVKSGSSEIIEIPAPEVGKTIMWDLTVAGWDVNYKEEFVPTDEGSYTVIVQKAKKISWQEGIIRNSFKNKEPGKIIITIENGAFKKKRILYRFKTKNESASSS